MSQVDIRIALEKKLATVSDNFPTAEENTTFKPNVGTPYQESFLIPAAPANPTMGDNHYREEGLFQVNLHYPTGRGIAAAGVRAELIKAAYKRGTTMVENGISVIVELTPEVMKGYPGEQRWWIVPIRIRWFAEIFN